jgi:hypothetical protein
VLRVISRNATTGNAIISGIARRLHERQLLKRSLAVGNVRIGPERQIHEIERHLWVTLTDFSFEAERVIGSSWTQKELSRALNGLSIDVHVHQIRFN